MIQSYTEHGDNFDVILCKFVLGKEVLFYSSVPKIKKRVKILEFFTFTTEYSENIFCNQWAKYAIRKINKTVNMHIYINYIFNGITVLKLETLLIKCYDSNFIFIILRSLQRSSADLWARRYMCKFIYFIISVILHKR